jgi:N,N'-diacetyllegionaminate synthase
LQRTLIIAEAGVNHNGSIELAKGLIDAAVDAGVDVVKFQTFKAENLVSKSAKKAAYQTANTGNNDSQYAMLKQLELTKEAHIELMAYCVSKNIEFWSTAFDTDSILLLQQLGITKWKIPSGEITNLPFLEKIGALKQEIIMSTGMCKLTEIEDAIQVLTQAGTLKEAITILHCNTEYPTPMQDVNLRAMQTIKEHFNVTVGYSDHTDGIEVPIAAVALGAQVIEKHFTLDKSMQGPDHKASLNPQELNVMVAAIRNIEVALGSSTKAPSPSEEKNISIARKSIVASKNIKIGETFSEDNLTTKRPGDGLSPMTWYDVIGKQAGKDFDQDEKITLC